MPFPGVKVPATDSIPGAELVPEAAETVGAFGGLSSVLSPVAGGLGLAGGLTNLFGGSGGQGTSDKSEATGYLYGGSFNPMIIGGSNNTLIIVILIVLAVIFLMRK
jgi:hypothetical protein